MRGQKEQLSRIVAQNNQQLLERDGFLVDPAKPRALELQRIIRKMPAEEYESSFLKMTCHVLCANNNPFPRVRTLIGLGLNFCLRKTIQRYERG